MSKEFKRKMGNNTRLILDLEADDFERKWGVRFQRSKRANSWTDRQRTIFNKITRGQCAGNFLPAANSHIQRTASGLLTEIARKWVAKHSDRVSGPRRLRQITLIFSDMYVPTDNPEFWISKIKSRTRNALYELGLSAFLFVEFEYTKLPSEDGVPSRGMVCYHVNGLCWSDDEHFKPKHAEQFLNSKRAFKSSFGRPAVKIAAMPSHDVESIFKLVRYALKLPAGIKKISKQIDDTGNVSYKVRHNMEGWSGNIAVRMVEIYSQIDITELSFAVGEGKLLRAKWKKKLRQAFANSLGNHLTAVTVGRFWNDVKSVGVKQPLNPVLFHHKNPLPRKRSAIS